MGLCELPLSSYHRSCSRQQSQHSQFEGSGRISDRKRLKASQNDVCGEISFHHLKQFRPHSAVLDFQYLHHISFVAHSTLSLLCKSKGAAQHCCMRSNLPRYLAASRLSPNFCCLIVVGLDLDWWNCHP